MNRWIVASCLVVALIGMGRDAAAECGNDCHLDLCSSDQGLYQYSPTMVKGLAEATTVAVGVVRIDRTFGVVPAGFEEGTEHDPYDRGWYGRWEATVDRFLVFFIAGRPGKPDWTRLLPLDPEGNVVCRDGSVELEKAAAIALSEDCFRIAAKAGLTPCVDSFDDDVVGGCGGCMKTPPGLLGLIGVVVALGRRRTSS